MNELADGSGAWPVLRRVIIDDSAEVATEEVVRTPLDLIVALESTTRPVAEVVLSGSFAANGWFRFFLEASYPTIRVHQSEHP